MNRSIWIALCLPLFLFLSCGRSEASLVLRFSGIPDAHTETLQRQYEAVTQYLSARGVDPAKMTTRHHGESFPVKKGRDPQSRAENRRVTIRLERF